MSGPALRGITWSGKERRIDGEKRKKTKKKCTRNYVRERKRQYELHDVIRAIDCAMKLALRMQNFSTPVGDRFFYRLPPRAAIFLGADLLFKFHVIIKYWRSNIFIGSQLIRRCRAFSTQLNSIWFKLDLMAVNFELFTFVKRLIFQTTVNAASVRTLNMLRAV